ncbi:MAG TPA: RidA family protein [Gaiellaceae bacterium]|nr:RidA family protein [Gaiellaceae bacterium]
MSELPFERVVIVDGVAYVSGQIATDAESELVARGRVGEEVDVETAIQCAEACARNLLRQLELLPGGLESVERLVKLTVFVAVTEGFDRAHVVANGASEVLLSALGERGKHARSAIGVASLPLGSPVEVEAIARLATSPDA